MPQSLVQIYVHFVFSTKMREPFLADAALRNETHAILGGICNRLGCPPIRVGGWEDHVHVLCRFSKSLEVEDFMRVLKVDSSKWVKERTPKLQTFRWQSGYSGFSVGPERVDSVAEYILNQEAHHR